jgi:hypothetical protein
LTAGYIIADVEHLRQPMRKITDYILKSIQLKGRACHAKLSSNKNKLNYRQYLSSDDILNAD